MHICFVSYWGLNEGLSRATVLPHLRILADDPRVKRITLITIEREPAHGNVDIDKVQHLALPSSPALTHKLFDKSRGRKAMESIHRETSIDLVIARSSLAGWMCIDFCTKHKVPLVVESFEPHADYMRESGVWKRLDPRYILTRRAEHRLMRKAAFLLPVSRRYADHLIAVHNVDPEKVKVMPCCVDPTTFAFDAAARARIREQLGLKSDHVVGIYTGKLGGMYLHEEAIALFRAAAEHWKCRFFLIILSPDRDGWKTAMGNVGFTDEDVYVNTVLQHEVADYLSAADFAFSLHKPGPAKMGISPIKNGEYLASGLPVMIPRGIGDDSHEIEKWNLGVVFSLEELGQQEMFNNLDPMIVTRTTETRIAAWAAQKRGFNIVVKHYKYILDNILSKS